MASAVARARAILDQLKPAVATNPSQAKALLTQFKVGHLYAPAAAESGQSHRVIPTVFWVDFVCAAGNDRVPISNNWRIAIGRRSSRRK
jgi:hypothetical protein